MGSNEDKQGDVDFHTLFKNGVVQSLIDLLKLPIYLHTLMSPCVAHGD